MFDTGWLWVCNKLTPNMYSVPVHMIKNAYFYFCVLAVPKPGRESEQVSIHIGVPRYLNTLNA